jgi:proline iminopeptidase
MRPIAVFAALVALVLVSCSPTTRTGGASSAYHDNTGRTDVLSGGVRMIPIHTPRGDFRVWTKRVGNNPRLKVLLLHGGPGATHEYFEAFDSFLPGAGVEYYYYDQLGSAYSDQPNDSTLWTIPRFVDEVEQVRVALGSTPPTSSCSVSRGAASWPWSTRSRIRATSRASSSRT